MAGRTHGTWAQWHEDIYDHPKTLKFAAALVKLGIPEAFAVDHATACFHRLCCWAIRDGVTGQIGHLSDQTLAQICRFAKADHAAGFRKALATALLVDWGGQIRARIHDFASHFAPILRHRSAGGRTRKPMPAKALRKQSSTDASSDGGSRLARAKHAPGTRPRARASEPEPEPELIPPTPSHARAPNETSPQGVGGYAGEEPNTTDQTIGIRAGIVQRLAAMFGPPDRRHRATHQVVSALLDCAGGDERLATESIRAYQRLDDPWLLGRGYDAIGLKNRMNAAIENGRKTMIAEELRTAPPIPITVKHVPEPMPTDERRRELARQLRERFTKREEPKA